MNYDPAARDDFYQSILRSPGERGEVDYKASMPLGNRDSFTLKLYRHMIGMANSGGGTIVIGFSEDGDNGYIADPSHDNAINGTYDTTDLSNRVNRFLHPGDERLVVEVHHVKYENTEAVFPVLHVEGFTRSPFFCRSQIEDSDTGETILEQDALYIRRPNAETNRLSSPQDWNNLIDLCVQLRRDDFLSQFVELGTAMGFAMHPPSSQSDESIEWVEEQRQRATE